MIKSETIEQLQARIAELEAELQPFREARKRTEEGRARLRALRDALSPEPEMTPEEEVEALQGLADMFQTCGSCGLSRMSAVEDEACHCCHGCNTLRQTLRDVLGYYERTDDPLIQTAWKLVHDFDPASAQVTQIAYALKRRHGLFAERVAYDGPEGLFYKHGWRLRVAHKMSQTLVHGAPIKVYEDLVVVFRPDLEKPLRMRVCMPRGNTIEEVDSDEWFEVYETIVDYYRSRGLIPPEDTYPDEA